MKYRVLVVDDSVVMRRIVRQSLESDPEIEVAGVAANGKIALAMVAQLTLDAITLDIEMPEMNGLQALRELRARGINTPVIMFSTLTERGALATLDALAAGADDYVAKPANVGSVQDSIMRIQLEVVPKIKALCWKTKGYRWPLTAEPPNRQLSSLPLIPALPHPALPAPVADPLASPAPAGGQQIDIVAIGTSTGGPNALAEVIPHIPAEFPVPIVIVQHMPPTFTRFLAERLTAASPLLVTEGATGAVLSPGRAWIAPGDFHMTVRRENDLSFRLSVFQAPPENSCRPSVDVLFRSVAQVCKANVLAVVMTGMGQDGLRGCEHVKEANGQVIVQDEASSVVWGMPGYVAKAGLADCVLPVSEIAGEIVRRVNRARIAPSLALSLATPLSAAVAQAEHKGG
jgi:two-component system chemotaxis response regulator CheB